MSHGFTHYWNQESWEGSRQRGGDLRWLASSQWERRGVRADDAVYPITMSGGTMYLGGRMIVAQVVTRPEAIDILGTDDIWEAPLVAIGKPGLSTTLAFNRVVPTEIVRQLRFDTSGEERPPILHGDELDQQTLRGVRRLTPDSKSILDELLLRP